MPSTNVEISMWIIIFLLGAGTYLIRLSFIALFGRIEPPMRLQKALRFVPAAVLSALIFPDFLYRNGTINLSLGNVRLIAGMIAAFIAWKTRSALLTIVLGMIALWVLQAVIH